MQNNHDPYLQTAARSIDNKIIQNRKKKLDANRNNKKKGFFNQEIAIEDYFTFSKSMTSLLITKVILFFPYLIGLISMLIIFNLEVASYYTEISLQNFLFSWLIGYEVIAFTLLIIIFKNAYSFSRKKSQ